MAIIKTPGAGVSPYQESAAADPTVLTTTVNGRTATVASATAAATDADSVTFGNLYVGGSGNAMPVWSNGTNWYIG